MTSITWQADPFELEPGRQLEVSSRTDLVRLRRRLWYLDLCKQGVVRLVYFHNVNVLDNLTYLIGAGHAICFHVVQSKRRRRGNRGGVGDYTGLYVVIR